MPFEAQPRDMVLYVRDGMPILKSPMQRESEIVPEDFLVLVGVATAFLDPGFRAMMKAIVREQAESGRLDSLFTNNEPVH